MNETLFISELLGYVTSLLMTRKRLDDLSIYSLVLFLLDKVRSLLISYWQVKLFRVFYFLVFGRLSKTCSFHYTYTRF